MHDEDMPATGRSHDALSAASADRYRIERELGHGGMATVYLAHDVKHDRKVALKVLAPALAAVVRPDRFLAEIKTTANLQHPHIVALFDSCRVDGTCRQSLDRDRDLGAHQARVCARERRRCDSCRAQEDAGGSTTSRPSFLRTARRSNSTRGAADRATSTSHASTAASRRPDGRIYSL